MDANVLASKRFWFGIAGAVIGALVLSFAGDPSVPSWLVKVLGALNTGCALAVSLLQSAAHRRKHHAPK